MINIAGHVLLSANGKTDQHVFEDMAKKYALVDFVFSNDASNPFIMAGVMNNMRCKSLVYVNSEAVILNSYEDKYLTAVHPDWFIYNGTGGGKAVVTEASYSSNKIIDITNPAVRAWRIARLQRILKNKAYGIFFDVTCGYFISSYYSADPMYTDGGVEITAAAWTAANALYIAEANAAGIPLLINDFGLYNGARYFANQAAVDANLASAEAALMEGYQRGISTDLTTFKAETNGTNDSWVNDQNAILANPEKIIPYIFIANDAANISLANFDKWIDFFAGSAALAVADRGHVMYRQAGTDGLTPKTALGISKNYWPIIHDYFRRLGSPSESFTDIASAKNRLTGGTNTYHRAFSNGIVLVNPTASNDAAVELGGTYYDLAGASYTSVAMNAHTGLILLSTAP